MVGGRFKTLFSQGIDLAKKGAQKAAQSFDAALEIVDQNLQNAIGTKLVHCGEKKLWLGKVLDKEQNRETFVARDVSALLSCDI